MGFGSRYQKPPAEQTRWEHAREKKRHYPYKWKVPVRKCEEWVYQSVTAGCRLKAWVTAKRVFYLFIYFYSAWGGTREKDSRYSQLHLFFIDTDYICPPPGLPGSINCTYAVSKMFTMTVDFKSNTKFCLRLNQRNLLWQLKIEQNVWLIKSSHNIPHISIFNISYQHMAVSLASYLFDMRYFTVNLSAKGPFRFLFQWLCSGVELCCFWRQDEVSFI